jgi:ubiquinone/menaquinone biosynthesis C-methylase UbiE
MSRKFRIRIKELTELLYWRIIKIIEGDLTNTHYKFFYTAFFQKDDSFYDSKIILDIGCGPRGSLEWAENSLLRIGLDPLASKYRKLNGRNNLMQLVNGTSENIPFKASTIDVITSFNSLDHVHDVNFSIEEIHRVLKPNGIFLLITELNHKPSLTEPQSFSWDIIQELKKRFIICSQNNFEKSSRSIYTSLRSKIPFNFQDRKRRTGIIACELVK